MRNYQEIHSLGNGEFFLSQSRGQILRIFLGGMPPDLLFDIPSPFISGDTDIKFLFSTEKRGNFKYLRINLKLAVYCPKFFLTLSY